MTDRTACGCHPGADTPKHGKVGGMRGIEGWSKQRKEGKRDKERERERKRERERERESHEGDRSLGNLKSHKAVRLCEGEATES